MNDIDAATDIYGRYGGSFELKTVQSFGMSSHHAIWNLKDGDRLFGVGIFQRTCVFMYQFGN